MSIKSLLNSLTGTGRDPSSLGLTGDTAKTIPDASYLMQNLLKGDLSSSLTSGEKLMALGALLRSAGRGSQTTPQEVMGEIRKTAQNRTAIQLQLAQFQAAMAQKAQLDAAWQEYTKGLTPEQQKAAAGASDEDKQSALKDFYAPKAFGTKEVNGETYMIFSKGPPVKLDMPRNTEILDTGARKIIVYKGTTEQVPGTVELPNEMSEYQARSLQQGQQRIDISRGNLAVSQQRLVQGRTGGGGTGSTPVQITDDKGKPRIVQWNKNDQAYYEVGTGKRVTRGPSRTSGFTPSIPLTPGKPKYGAR